MVSYSVGERLHIDGSNEQPGFPIIDDNGQKVCVPPEDLAYLGYGVDVDAANWSPDNITGE